MRGSSERCRSPIAYRYVYGIGNVNHKPDIFFVLRPSGKPAPDQKEMDWFNRVSQEAPLPLTLTSIYLDLKAIIYGMKKLG